MRIQSNPGIKAHLIRSAFYMLLLITICAVPFALAQRKSFKQSHQFQKALGQWQQLTVPGTGQAPDLSPWTIVAPYPEILEVPAVASDGTYAYSTTGLGNPISNGLYRYDPVADSWTPLAPMPEALYDARAVYAANVNKVYVFGGFDVFFNVHNTNYIYDIATNAWTTGTPMPDGRIFVNAAYYSGGGKIYVIGGFVDGQNEASQTWEYDPVADTWDTSRSDIPVPMGGSATSIVGQNIYLAGSFGAGAATNFHYRYDILADSWTAMASLPTAVYAAAGAAIGTNTYVVGGGNLAIGASANILDRSLASIRAPATSFNTTFIYDTLTDAWTSGPNTNVAHAFTGGTAIGNRLLVIAGFDGTNATNVVETAVEETPTPTPTPGGCVYGQGYWKNHPDQWPVAQLQLGNVTYDQQQLLDILHQPVRGNGLVLLAHQLIAAKLNIDNGADGSCIQQIIADADALIGDLVVPPVGTGYLAPRDVSALADTLDQYNEGGLCAPHCEQNEPTPTATPAARSRPLPAARPRPR
jgi:N-acetylneuraminic acid mutarotase